MLRRCHASVCLCFGYFYPCLTGSVLPGVGRHRWEEEDAETESHHRPTRHRGLWRWKHTHARTHIDAHAHLVSVVSADRWNIWVETLSDASMCDGFTSVRLCLCLCGVTLCHRKTPAEPGTLSRMTLAAQLELSLCKASQVSHSCCCRTIAGINMSHTTRRVPKKGNINLVWSSGGMHLETVIVRDAT